MQPPPSTSKIPLLDLKSQLEPLRQEILDAIAGVVDSTTYIMGPKVQELEKAIADYSGISHAVGVSSGTDALLLSLMALDVGPGDLVLTTPFSFFATAGVVARLNATPVLVDIAPDTYNLDPAKLAAKLESYSPEEIKKVKAVIPVHLYGQCADLDPIMEITNRYNIPVIEDAAQAIGAEYPSKNGPRRAGAMGATGCFSFFPSKNLGAIGDAGMVVTNDDALAEVLRIKRVHGGHPKYFHGVIGGNFRLDPVQAAVLLVKLPHLDKWHRQRQENADYYTSLFAEKNLKQVTTPVPVYRESGVPHYHIYNQYVVRTPQRDALRNFLTEQGIGNEVYYPLAFHEQECFKGLGYKRGDFPESEKAAQETLALPIYPELTQEMQTRVVETIAQFLGK